MGRPYGGTAILYDKPLAKSICLIESAHSNFKSFGLSAVDNSSYVAVADPGFVDGGQHKLCRKLYQQYSKNNEITNHS